MTDLGELGQRARQVEHHLSGDRRHDRPQVGLVLAGGAAKGAYELGVIDFLARYDVPVAAVAGTSIGALNGAMLAGAPTLAEAAEQLRAVWDEFGARFVRADPRLRSVPARSATRGLRDVAPLLHALGEQRAFLEEMVHALVHPAHIRAGRPFWVAAYPMLTRGTVPELLRYVLEWQRVLAGHRADLLRLNDIAEDEEIRRAVLASSALPFLFPARPVGGRYYRDGWLGRDNIPIRALVGERIDYVVVVHLQRGIVVNEHEHLRLVRIDIRPSRDLRSAGTLGGLTGLLDFSPDRVADLRALGYADARTSFQHALAPVAAARSLRESEQVMTQALARLRQHLREAGYPLP